MRSNIFRWFAIAIVVGFGIAFLNRAVWIKPTVRYQPPLSETELKSYDTRSVSDLKSFMKSRSVPMTRVEILSEELRTPTYWRWLAEDSIVPASGVLIALLLASALDHRRHSPPQRSMLRN